MGFLSVFISINKKLEDKHNNFYKFTIAFLCKIMYNNTKQESE